MKDRQQIGMATVQDLSDYHLQFMAITTWLIKKGQLCELGQKWAYIRAFPVQLLPTIITRLQVNFPKHHPGIPYPVTDVYNTVRSILQGIPFLGFTSQVQPITAPVLPTNVPFKAESLAPVMAKSTKIIIEAVKEAEIFNLKRARETAPKQPTVSIPNSQPTIPAQPYRSARNTAYAPPANRNFAIQDKPNKEKQP